MAAVTITRNRTPGNRNASPTPSSSGAHPKAVIVPENGPQLVMPYAPAGVSLTGIAPTFSQITRPGRKPLQSRDADQLPQMPLPLILARRNPQASIEDLIDRITALAESGDRITLVNLSPRERGPWRIVDAALEVTRRQHGTNLATRATYNLTLEAASDVLGRGPLSGGSGSAGGGLEKARKYVIKKGDTLRKLAQRFYGEPGEWRRIARKNNIKDPDNLKVGRTITIPADDED